jgi:hypothetical protein
MSIPICTSNSLKDVVDWINGGALVYLYAKGNVIKYHKCDTYNNTCTKTIHINLQTWPDLLDEGEWPWYIEQDGRLICKCQNIQSNNETTYNFRL